jgi:predicted Rdx family selenoprotein
LILNFPITERMNSYIVIALVSTLSGIVIAAPRPAAVARPTARDLDVVILDSDKNREGGYGDKKGRKGYVRIHYDPEEGFERYGEHEGRDRVKRSAAVAGPMARDLDVVILDSDKNREGGYGENKGRKGYVRIHYDPEEGFERYGEHEKGDEQKERVKRSAAVAGPMARDLDVVILDSDKNREGGYGDKKGRKGYVRIHYDPEEGFERYGEHEGRDRVKRSAAVTGQMARDLDVVILDSNKNREGGYGDNKGRKGYVRIHYDPEEGFERHAY